jgi:mannosyl-oligosaccharide glucosidase
VNFFPIMFGLIDDPAQIQSSLRVLGDSEQMLAPAGIRSLSKQDQFYLYASDYWRGAVWINVNFLALRGLFNNYMGVAGTQEGEATFLPKQTHSAR